MLSLPWCSTVALAQSTGCPTGLYIPNGLPLTSPTLAAMSAALNCAQREAARLEPSGEAANIVATAVQFSCFAATTEMENAVLTDCNTQVGLRAPLLAKFKDEMNWSAVAKVAEIRAARAKPSR